MTNETATHVNMHNHAASSAASESADSAPPSCLAPESIQCCTCQAVFEDTNCACTFDGFNHNVMMARVKKVMDSLSRDASAGPLAGKLTWLQQEDLLMHRDSDCP